MSSGRPVGDKTNLLTIGPRGPTLLQDVAYLDEMAHFVRERIPERVVHAKGNAAMGYFELTNKDEISKYCSAALFNDKCGTRLPITVRFSTVGGEKGSADTVRDPRGFAVKFYTSEGNLDIVGNNTPIFFIRDPMQFPSMVHSQKRNPQTNVRDPDSFWDFLSLRPESIHQVCFLFSDRGIPDGYRYMHGFGAHTFKVINARDEASYVKFHFKSKQGIRNLQPTLATELAGKDPDYAGRDLFEAIRNKEFPAWRFCFQVMSEVQADKLNYNPFDITKTWSHKDYPLHEIGTIVLDKNPTNFFTEVEQLAFCPANLVPGIEPSPDKLLQGRLFAYSDAQRYRLGVNFNNLPVNQPHCPFLNPTFRDGKMCFSDNYGNLPNYYPNSLLIKINQDPKAMEHRQFVQGEVYRHDSSDDDNFSQAAVFWNNVLTRPERCALVQNMAGHLRQAKVHIQERMVDICGKVSAEFGKMLSIELKK